MRTLRFFPAAVLAVAGMAPAQTAATYISQITVPGTGNDSVARTQLRRLTNFTFRPGAEAERANHETALLAGLQGRPEWLVKSFLMGESQIQGKLSSVNPLAAYLADTNLCEPATQALLGIAATEGRGAVLAPVRSALLASSAGKCQVTLMRAAGSLRDADSAVITRMIQSASSADRGTRDVALRGLANIGDPRGAAVLAQARNSTNAYDRWRSIDLSLLFAIRIAQGGDRAGGIALANSIRATAVPDTNERHVVANADTTLNRIGLSVPVRTPGMGTGRGFSLLANSGVKIRVDVKETGRFSLKLVDPMGKILQRLHGYGPGEYAMAPPPVRGMYWAVGQGASGRYVMPIVRY